LPARGVDAVTVPGGVRGWEVLRRFGARLTWDRSLESAEAAARAGVPVAPSLATHIADVENADLFGSEDFDRVFRPNGRSLDAGDALVQPALADTFATLRRHGPVTYEGELAERTVAYLRSRGSDLAAEDFAEFQPETVEPISVDFGDLTVLTSPPNTHGFLLLRALRASTSSASPIRWGWARCPDGIPPGQRITHRVARRPRYADVDVAALIGDGLAEMASSVGRNPDPRGTTRRYRRHRARMATATPCRDPERVPRLRVGLIDPATGVLFCNRGRASRRQLAQRHRATQASAHTPCRR
jgi:gamma-glutamyltranspeptidase/glutathione hydrolase